MNWEIVGAIASSVSALASLVAITFLDNQVLDLQTIDRIFAGRFFYLFNNPHVMQLMNTTEINPYVMALRGLYTKWYDYRKAQNLPIPMESAEVHSHALQ